jgi:predicted Holliday junction resolvase-like endonuclease
VSLTYVAFNGMGAGRVREVVFLARPAETTAGERLQRSIEKTVANGNLEFKTLHVDKHGTVAAR